MSEWKLGDANKTTAYILPMLNQNGKIKASNIYSTGNTYPQRNFVSSFSFCEEYPDLKQRIFLLYKKELDNPVYQNFETRFRNFKEYEFEYEPDNVHKMYVFKLDYPESIFDCFVKGKFSKFPNYFKDIILNFHELNPELFLKQPDTHKNRIVGVLFKQKWLKEEIESTLINHPSLPKHEWVRLGPDDEYSSLPYMERETYLNKYKL